MREVHPQSEFGGATLDYEYDYEHEHEARENSPVAQRVCAEPFSLKGVSGLWRSLSMDLRVVNVIDSQYLWWSSWLRSAERGERNVRFASVYRYDDSPRSVRNEKGYPNEKG